MTDASDNIVRHPVTDHAVLMFIKRRLDVDVEAIREAILTPELERAINLGAMAMKLDGFRHIIKDRRLVTMYPHEANWAEERMQSKADKGRDLHRSAGRHTSKKLKHHFGRPQKVDRGGP